MNQPAPPNFTLITEQLIAWYQAHHRSLPWRQTQNPYYIWLSEVILQQTRVQQGLPYYQAFVREYPSVQQLAAAPQPEVLRLWQGLGYYSRARNLHACAQKVVAEYGGNFPTTYAELQKLPGIGRYTAAAIASFAFGEVVPVVDGNVYRVLARLFAQTTDIASAGAFSAFFALAQKLIDPQQPALFNQAIMEFGATQCTPKKPLCLYCPLKAYCQAYALGMQQELPVKSKKSAVRTRYFHYIVCTNAAGALCLQARPAGDIWQGLYQFPLLETNDRQLPDSLLPYANDIVEESPLLKHQLSHQTLYARFYRFRPQICPINENTSGSRVQEPSPEASGWFSPAQVEKLPKPVLISNYLKEAGF